MLVLLQFMYVLFLKCRKQHQQQQKEFETREMRKRQNQQYNSKIVIRYIHSKLSECVIMLLLRLSAFLLS